MKTTFFSAEFLEGLPSDEIDAITALCDHFRKFDSHAGGKTELHEDYLEIHSILDAFAQHRGIKFIESVNASFPNAADNIGLIRARFKDLSEKVTQRRNVRFTQGHIASKKQHYAAFFAGVSCYEFSENDFERIQTLINELRELITSNQLLSEGHRARLLKRLEAMQRELHKKTSDIDRFWGFIGEAGVNAKKFGENLKPITDRVRELGVIVLAVIFAREGIPLPPEGIKLLLPEK